MTARFLCCLFCFFLELNSEQLINTLSRILLLPNGYSWGIKLIQMLSLCTVDFCLRIIFLHLVFGDMTLLKRLAPLFSMKTANQAFCEVCKTKLKAAV